MGAIADKNEACAALQPGASANGGWPRSMLTESGKYIKDGLTGNWWQVGCCKFGNDCADFSAALWGCQTDLTVYRDQRPDQLAASFCELAHCRLLAPAGWASCPCG